MDSATLGVDRPQHRYDLRPRTKRVLYFAQSSCKRMKVHSDRFAHLNNDQYSNERNINTIIPEEIVRLVFSFLPIHAKMRCRRVCKYWKEISESILKKEKIISVRSIFGNEQEMELYRPLPSLFTRPMLKSFFKFCPNIEVIDVEEFYAVFNGEYENTLPSFSNRSVIINKFISLNDKSVKALTSKYSSSLKCLNLSCGEYTLEIRETTLMAVIKSCEKLEELKLGRCSKITGKCFREFRNSLKKLQLDFASDIWAGSTFGYLREIASGESHQSLTSLDLKWNINTCCVNIIRYCNQIIPDLVQDPIELFSNRFCNLTILKWDLPSVHHKPGNFKVLSKLTKLEELYLTGCDDYSVNDDSLTQIMSSCVNISIFEIKGIYNPFFPEPQTQELHGITEKYLTDVSLKKLPFLCRKMKSLKLSWVKSQKITDEFLVSLASHKNLQSVNLEQLTNITEEGVVKLITTSKNIRYLTFSECTLLTKQVIDSIINKIHSSKLNMNLTFIQNKQTYCHPGFSVNHNFQL